MVSVEEAKKIIQANTKLLAPVTMPLSKTSGLVLAEDVYANVSVPNFHQSAMDGYAFCFKDYLQAKELIIRGEVAAGDKGDEPLIPNHAVRIFTGAPVPANADTVVMQEKTEVINNKLIILDEQIQQGSNVRAEGSEIKKDDLALTRGAVLTPAAIGFLAGIGITEVSVYPKPSVHIITTGKELQKPGAPLQHGQVYESNSFMLQAALQQLHITDNTIVFAGDDVAEIQTAINDALSKADLILLTGGVSVGDYDFVVQAAQANDVQQLFHKVKQRPGKPLYVGKKENKIVFGLPGNPASVLSCFYNYVITAIEELTGKKNLIEKKYLPLATSFNKKISLTQFLKAVCNENEVMPLQAQESFRLSSFSVANCLIVLPEEKMDFAQGEIVETLILPYL